MFEPIKAKAIDIEACEDKAKFVVDNMTTFYVDDEWRTGAV